ncbi:siderophore-interacting protein [Diaphorobacter sp.]|uniref:siderophore-interacting protein n=1 Tax=Diaphorobacter sp. TaxID=1934310 RepID=UPI0028ABF7F7|nr:siderophore-interacting protein [Diaphorobacter sp.]
MTEDVFHPEETRRQQDSATPSLTIKRVRQEFASRHMKLLAREIVSPGFVRLTLGGADLADFRSDGFDDHVKLLLPAVGQEKPLLPTLVDGRPHFGEGERPTARDYTPVRWDARKGTLVLEFAVHDEGPATLWALHAQPGQWVGIAGPRGSMVVPTQFAWHWLLGDASALPAIERRLAELPAQARVTVRVQLNHAADRRALPSAAQVDLQWVDALDQAAQVLTLPADDGFIWAAGESSDMTQLRRTLLAKPGVDPKRMRISAYWKRGAQGHHEELVEN